MHVFKNGAQDIHYPDPGTSPSAPVWKTTPVNDNQWTTAWAGETDKPKQNITRNST